MPSKHSLIQLSSYDPRVLQPEGSPLGARVKPATEAPKNAKKEKLLRKFREATDPKERMKLLEVALKES